MSSQAAVAANVAAPEASFLLETLDGQKLRITENAARVSKTLRDLIDNLKIEPNNVIPITKMTEFYLTKIIEWCEHHKEDSVMPVPIETNSQGIIVPEWDAQFLDVEHELLIDLLVVANYFGILKLYDFACKVLADRDESENKKDSCDYFQIEVEQRSLEDN